MTQHDEFAPPDRDTGDDASPPVLVPWQELSADALRGVAESFVLREGTDYGEHEVSFDAKVSSVLRQLERREAVILFDPRTESVQVALKRDVDRTLRGEG